MGMNDQDQLEKVIAGLKRCMNYQCDVCQEEEGSGYPPGGFPFDCAKHDTLVNEAVAMLEEQKAVRPSIINHIKQEFSFWECGNCHAFFVRKCVDVTKRNGSQTKVLL